MNRHHRSVLLSIITLALLAGTAGAQVDGRDRGAYIGIRFHGSSLHVDSENDAFFIKDDGGGATLYGGYSFNDVFSLELAVTAARHETSDQAIDANFGTGQIFAHYRFAPGRAFRPYVKGGLGGYGLVLDTPNGDIDIGGGGVAIGGGFDYFFSPHFSLGVDFTHNIINYEEVSVDIGNNTTLGFDIDEEGAMTSLGLSLGYYF